MEKTRLWMFIELKKSDLKPELSDEDDLETESCEEDAEEDESREEDVDAASGALHGVVGQVCLANMSAERQQTVQARANMSGPRSRTSFGCGAVDW